MIVQDPSTMVIDHLSYAVVGNEGDHTLIASDELIQSDVILGSGGTGVSFTVTMTVFNTEGWFTEL